MAVTLKEVATKAGVSVAAVSMALNGHKKGRCKLSAETVKNVSYIAKSMGYRPNMLATSLKNNQTHMIGILIAALKGDFYEQILYGVEQVIYPHFTPVLGVHNYDVARERKQLEGFMDKRLDGVIAAYSGAVESIAIYTELSKYNIPIVLVDRGIPGMDLPVVRSDHFTQTYKAVEALNNLGHREIVYVSGGRKLECTDLRKQGYISAMNDLALGQFIYVIEQPQIKKLPDYASFIIDLYTNTSQLKNTTAFIIQNDWLAYHVLHQCKARKIQVPQEISVMGLDDCLLSSLDEISLSSVAQTPELIGLKAGELLLKIMDGWVWERNPVIVPVEVILRKTTSSPSKSG